MGKKVQRRNRNALQTLGFGRTTHDEGEKGILGEEESYGTEGSPPWRGSGIFATIFAFVSLT